MMLFNSFIFYVFQFSYIFLTLLNLADAVMRKYNEYFIHLLVNMNTMDTVFVNDMYGS